MKRKRRTPTNGVQFVCKKNPHWFSELLFVYLEDAKTANYDLVHSDYGFVIESEDSKEKLSIGAYDSRKKQFRWGQVNCVSSRAKLSSGYRAYILNLQHNAKWCVEGLRYVGICGSSVFR
jgi:hypothetical protein